MTDNKDILVDYTDIKSFPIGEVKADKIAIVCTGKGMLPWLSKESKWMMIKTLYCAEVDWTIVPPTTIVQQYTAIYQRFTIITDMDNGTGVLKLLNRDGVQHITYPMTLKKGLWYYKLIKCDEITRSISKLNVACLSNLWHGKLVHAGYNVVANIHKHVIEIDKPIKRKLLYKCGSCLPKKISKESHNRWAK